MATAVPGTTLPFKAPWNNEGWISSPCLFIKKTKPLSEMPPSWLPLTYKWILNFKRSQTSSVRDSRFCNCPGLDQTSHNTPLGWPLCHCERNRSSYGGTKEEDELCWQQTMSYHSSLLCQLCGEVHRCLHSLCPCLHLNPTSHLNRQVNDWSISKVISISIETKRPQ